MTISPATTEAGEGGAHCWVTIRREHEPAFQALLNTVTVGSQFLYTPVGEIRINGLSNVKQAEMIQGREDLIYIDKHGSIFALEELWNEVEDGVAETAPHATIEHRIAISLSLADPNMIEKLRTELRRHPMLNYTEIEFGED